MIHVVAVGSLAGAAVAAVVIMGMANSFCYAVIPGHAPSSTRNLEVSDSLLRAAPE
jgi:hypothetical protein